MTSSSSTITYETVGPVAQIGLNRAEKRNAFSLEMLRAFSAAFERAEADEAVRAIVVFAHGNTFTGGLDILDVFPQLGSEGLFTSDTLDPWGTHGRERTKPMLIAVHGKCLTLGIELMLAADIVIAAENATFAQIEIARGLFPFGGGTARWVERAGWGNAMRYLLTGDEFGAAEALRLGLVQQVVADGDALKQAQAIAERIAQQAPLGVMATIRSARLALHEGERVAAKALMPEIQKLAMTADVQEGIAAFMQRRPAVFQGK